MSEISVISDARARRTRRKSRARDRQTSSAWRNDVVVYRMVVAFLGLVMLAAIVGALFTPGGNPPQILIALGTGALGALGGLLAPSPVGGQR